MPRRACLRPHSTCLAAPAYSLTPLVDGRVDPVSGISPSHVPPLNPSECQVWWAHLADCRPAYQRLLNQVEAGRRAAYRAIAEQDT